MDLTTVVIYLNHVADAWIASAVTGLLTVIVIGALCALIHRFLSPALRCWLWWLICARLAFAAVGGLVGMPRFAISVVMPFVGRSAPNAPALPTSHGAANWERSENAVSDRLSDHPNATIAAKPQRGTTPRPTAVACLFLLWSLGAVASCCGVGRESFRLHRTLRAARDLSATSLASDMREIAIRLGIATPPQLVEVPGAASPFVAGLRRPVLALPPDLDGALSHDELQMALAHELAHLRRGDLYLALIPLVARALCFCVPFIPAFAYSEWATAREADCDAKAMEATAAAPDAYSHLLIKIVRGDVSAHHAPINALGATASFHTLRARLQFIRHSSEMRRDAPAWIAVFFLLAACAIVPWRSGLTSNSATPAPLVPLATPNDARDVADVTAFSTVAGNDPDKRYILIGAREGASPPPNGYRLVIVLPGGDGGANFNYFVRRLQQRALGEQCLVAELVAKQWDARQSEDVVWPTRTNSWPSMRFSTEEFAASVVNDVEARFPIDKRQVFSLSWASGGPAGYALSLAPATPITGSFVAMSTFASDTMPPLTAARGHAYYLLHPDDASMVPLVVAEDAENRLRENGADVTLATYAGGYGWNGDVYGQVRRGMQFLEDHTTVR